jgi:hypothetical protein
VEGSFGEGSPYWADGRSGEGKIFNIQRSMLNAQVGSALGSSLKIEY